MPDHIKAKHGGDIILEDFENEFAITRDERIHLKIEKGLLDRQPTKRGEKRRPGEQEDVPQGKKARK